MKHLHLYILFLLGIFCWTGSAQSQAITLSTFDIVADGSDILVSWDLPNETDIQEFRLFRRFNEATTSTHVAPIKPNGSGDYSYLDDDIFKQGARVLHYDLQIVTRGQTYTYSRNLVFNPTSIQRTWGSIKSMFRY